MSRHFHPLTVSQVRKETASCVSVSFEVPPHLETVFNFTQGQNITLKTEIGGEILRRSYSICSSPLENELRIAVKKVAEGKFSSWANDQLKKGDVLEVMPPTGKFYTVLNAANKKNYMALAAGSGITPILSIIKTILAIEKDSRITLVYGNKNRGSIIFREQLEALKNTYMDRFSMHHILSREKMELPLYAGRIDEKKCDAIFTAVAPVKNYDDFFLCGPESMIFDIRHCLEQKGVEKEKIHFELFAVPGNKTTTIASNEVNKRSPSDKYSTVTIRVDGISSEMNVPYSGESILDAALRFGSDLPFACKGGVCATCRAKLIDGEVYMNNNYALESEELENRYILTCQSHPRSEKISIDFDFK